jgi:hypothetical protein
VPETATGLSAARAKLPDPRAAAGVWHQPAVVVTAAACAVVAGYRSYTAIAEWIADLPAAAALALGIAPDRRPSEAMIRRLLQALDPDLLTAAISGWLSTRAASYHRPSGARSLAGRGAHWILPVKADQPRLHAQLVGLPWRAVPEATRATDRGHGRREIRTCKIPTISTGIDFPHATQALQIRRRRRRLGCATSPMTRTAPTSALAPDRRSWPPSATPPWEHYAALESPTSGPPTATTPATAPAR